MTQNTVQSSYDRYAPKGANGAAASMRGWDADTKQAEETIGFGLAVSYGTEDNGVVKGGAAYCGVAMRDITLVHTTPDQYEEGDNMGVVTRGDIWITVEDAVVAHTAVKYNASTGQLGSSGGTTISGASWETSADAGELAVCRLGGDVDLTT